MSTQTQTTKRTNGSAVNESVGIDWDAIEGTNQDFLDIYPRLQWMHGKRQFVQLGKNNMNYTGGLFLPADQFPGFAAEGWNEASFIPSGTNSEEIKGWYSAKAFLSIIRIKRWWDDDGSHTHALCAIKGVDGLFCIQVGGISKGQAFENAFNDHRKQIVSCANRSKPAGRPGIEPLGLWFVVSPADHSMQKAKSGTAESEVTVPRLWTPEKVDVLYVRSLWVGTDNYREFCNAYKETENWQNQIPKSKQSKDVLDTDTINDAKVKEILDLCIQKDFPEDNLAMTVSQNQTNKIEMLNYREAREALQLLRDY